MGAEEGGICWADSCWRGDTPGGKLSRVDVGAFPTSRWKGVTIILQALRGLALRVVPQAVRNVRQSLLSSSMASASRHWMSLACNCWIKWVCEVPWDSASMIAVDNGSLPLLRCKHSWPQLPWYRWHAMLRLCLLALLSGPLYPWWSGHKGPSLPWWPQWSPTHFGEGQSQKLKLVSTDEHW